MNWRVDYIEHGRDGEVRYIEGGRTLSFYWEYGGGDVVFSLAVGDEGEWRAQHPDLADRRGEIIARLAGELIRRRAPSCRAQLDASGRFLHFIADPATAPARATQGEKQAAAAAFVWRLNRAKSRMSLIVLVLVLIAGAALLGGRTLLTVKTTGAPIGASARAGDFIATPIGRLEPYVPSLDRNRWRDRYEVGLLIHSARDPGARRYLRVAGGRTGADSAKARVTGAAGELIWFDAPETVVVDARTARILSADEAQRAPEPPRPKGAEALFHLATPERRLESLLAAPGEDGAPALAAGGEEKFNAAFLRAAPHGGALALPGGGYLGLYWTQRYREGVIIAARVDAAGAVIWRTETELGRLDEVLPDAERPALIGTRPRAEGRVPEPLLVVIDVQTGRAATRSLLVE